MPETKSRGSDVVPRNFYGQFPELELIELGRRAAYCTVWLSTP